MEDDFNIVKNTKVKPDIWRHFRLQKRKSDSTIVDIVAVYFICKMQPKTQGGGMRNLVTHLRRHNQ